MIRDNPNLSTISLLEDTDHWADPENDPKWQSAAKFRKLLGAKGDGKGVDAFNIAHSRTRYVALTSGGMSKAYSQLPDIGGLSGKFRYVSFYEKRAVVFNGKVKRLWATTPLSGKGNFSAFMADAQRNPFAIGPAYDLLWQSVEHAIKFSQVLTWRPVLVLKHIETIDWR